MREAQTLRSLEACRSLPILGKDGEAPLRVLGYFWRFIFSRRLNRAVSFAGGFTLAEPLVHHALNWRWTRPA
jgi:hypothetical protein